MLSSLLLCLVSFLAAVWQCQSNYGQQHQCLLSNMSWSETVDKDYRLKVITVATEETDGYRRFMRSAKVLDLDVEVFGLGDEWQKPNADDRPGGYLKLDALRTALLKYKDQHKLVLLFTDSYETIFTAGKSAILNKFKNTGANILISAEDYCWHDKSLKARYLVRNRNGYRYLCSSGIIGYAPAVYKMLSQMWLEPTSDYQLDARHMFFDDRKKYGIKWDRRSELFQNLDGYKEVVLLNFTKKNVNLVNTGYQTVPAVIHGNGPSKLHLTYLANYVPKRWTEMEGCLTCRENMFNLQGSVEEKWPRVLIGIFITTRTPFVDTFLIHISQLEYPKEKIDVFIHNSVSEHNTAVEDWIYEEEVYYKSIYHEGPTSALTDQQARNMGVFHCRKVKCDYYFSVDSIVSLTNRLTLQSLMAQNKPFIAPMVANLQKFWKNNFWGDCTEDGRYIRSLDFLEISKGTRRGIWNMPYVRDVYLIKSSVLKKIGVTPFHSEEFTSYFQFSVHLRDQGVFMHVTNMEYFGHLKDMKSYGTEHQHNDLYQFWANTPDWDKKYLHPHLHYVTSNLERGVKIDQPCQDVFTLPVFSRHFADHVIDEFERYGKWFVNGNISGGYDKIPLSAIQNAGLQEIWRRILKDHLAPIVTQLFPGSNANYDTSLDMATKQWDRGVELPLFNETSVFAINIALNEGGREGADYQGGGETYTRYDCTARHAKVGWALIRPGRFTHQYKNIAVTSGEKYNLVSLISDS